ncbi:MAG: hypothetical protein WCA08_19830 [Desulfoferrobacter sp.]
MWKIVPAIFFVFSGLLSLRAALDTLSGSHALVYGMIGLLSLEIGAVLMFPVARPVSTRSKRSK